MEQTKQILCREKQKDLKENMIQIVNYLTEHFLTDISTPV